MKHIGLFEGIGGFSLAARWMGWETIAWCEWNEFGQKVLKHHFPKANGHGDITKTDFTIYRGQCDILTGGFPCQPFSTAGNQQGTSDDRYLWPQMLRAITEIRPRWIVVENVTGIINLALDQVLYDLEDESYTTETFVIPACAVGAPHRRDRVWIIAHSNSNSEPACPNHVIQLQRRMGEVVADTIGGQQQDGREANRMGRKGKLDAGSSWNEFPIVSPFRTRDDGIPERLDTEAISERKWRKESVTAGGNAIVPQVAYQIFKAIQAYEDAQ